MAASLRAVIVIRVVSHVRGGAKQPGYIVAFLSVGCGEFGPCKLAIASVKLAWPSLLKSAPGMEQNHPQAFAG